MIYFGPKIMVMVLESLVLFLPLHVPDMVNSLALFHDVEGLVTRQIIGLLEFKYCLVIDSITSHPCQIDFP